MAEIEERSHKKGLRRNVVLYIAIAMGIYHLYTAVTGIPEAMLHRPRHLLFTLVLIFLAYPLSPRERKRRLLGPAIDFLCIGGALFSIGYIFVEYDYFLARMPLVDQLTSVDLAGGIILTLLILEACRRTTGFLLPALTLVFILYAYIGNLPGLLAHEGFSTGMVIDHFYSGLEGIFGIPLGVSSTYIILFIMFGSFLKYSGVGQGFSDFALAVAGDKKGGAAKVAVVASALMGMISGSAVANVVTTGAFTIPLMKKTGLSKTFAGAVEACASTGGQIMPPIMGAAAFLLAEFSGIPYLEVCLHAFVPACLYFFAVYQGVHLEATKTGIMGIPRSELPVLSRVLSQCWYMFLPIVMILGIMVMGYTPIIAVIYSIALVIGLSMFRAETRMGIKKIILAVGEGAENCIGTAASCACAGIIIGVVTLTGLGLKFSSFVIDLSGGHLIIALFFSMICALILGMGLPTAAAYIIQAALIVPALIQLGLPPITAHLFALYFAIISAITPPVALASFAAAGLAGSNITATSIVAFRLGLCAFIVPFMFVYTPSLLMIGVWYKVIIALATASIGVAALAAATSGWFVNQAGWFQRLLLFGGALLLIHGSIQTDLIGLSILAGVYLSKGILQKAMRKGFS